MPLSALVDRRPQPSLRTRLAWATLLAGALLALGCALQSDGAHHDDDLQHLQIARWAWSHPALLLDEWGRPGFTLLYLLPARFGWGAARLFTLLLAIATIILAASTAAQARGRAAWLVPLLLWLQPAWFTLSFTTLTEPVLAFYLTLAYWLYQRRSFAASCALISLAAITRHEALLFLPLWAAALWLQRRPWREWLLLAWAPSAHWLLGALFLPRAPAAAFLAATGNDEYGHGDWLTMLTRWALAAGLAQLALALVGLLLLWRAGRLRLLIACGVAYFAAHTLLFKYGLFASGGYERFMAPLAPLTAIAAAHTLGAWWRAVVGGRRVHLAMWLMVATGLAAAALLLWLAAEGELPAYRLPELEHIRRAAVVVLALLAIGAAAVMARRLRPCAAACDAQRRCWSIPARAAALLAFIGMLAAQPLVSMQLPEVDRRFTPLRLNPEQRLLAQACAWLRQAGYGGRPLLTANPWVREFTGLTPPLDWRFRRAALDSLPAGGLFIWEARYAPGPSIAVPLDEMLAHPDFRPLRNWPDAAGSPYCYIFEKTPGPAAAAAQDAEARSQPR